MSQIRLYLDEDILERSLVKALRNAGISVNSSFWEIIWTSNFQEKPPCFFGFAAGVSKHDMAAFYQKLDKKAATTNVT